MPKKAVVANQSPLGDNSAEHSDDEIELKPALVTQSVPQVPVEVPEVKQRKKKNLSEQQKEVLRERLKVAHARKKELAEARRAVKEQDEENHMVKKQLAILEQARLIKQRQKKEIDAVSLKPTETVSVKKTPKVKYIVEEDSSSEEEEIVVVKKKRTPKKSEPAPPPPPAPVAEVPAPPAFKIKFF
jgi:hypothetical protein